MPSAANAFNTGLLTSAFAFAFIDAFTPCFAASLAPKPTAVPVPSVKAPAIIDNKLVGSDIPAIV